jgi:hypothetical protein
MHTLAPAEENSMFGAIESLIGSNDAFCFIEKMEKEMEGRMRDLQGS